MKFYKLKFLIIACGIFFMMIFISSKSLPLIKKAMNVKLKKENENFNKIDVNLRDPEQSPEGIHDDVMLGFHIIIQTKEMLPDHVGGQVSCTNCHFSGGNTLGGMRGSIPLAGVAAIFPEYDSRSKEVITLQDRINNCFKRSLNGKPLEENSKEMKAIVTYIQWISKGFPIYQPIPWRGLKPLRSKHTPDPLKGAKLYEVNCSLCHGDEGEGGANIPPIWGPNSFNDGAGMNKIEKLSSFIFANMPYENVGLTEEEALDIASYVLQQPRPKFEN